MRKRTKYFPNRQKVLLLIFLSSLIDTFSHRFISYLFYPLTENSFIKTDVKLKLGKSINLELKEIWARSIISCKS